MSPYKDYLLNQRVIVAREIGYTRAPVLATEKDAVSKHGCILVYRESAGFASLYSGHNVQPLPGGQL